ncbi:sigma-70 family RNA polymerase sigma factor [Dysgonomonas sp. Marseille-P4677]|uniref:RNA polymerase sigma factor n=1 Tax=Dysgonomonas sp. Marseille-P4677 TaxID=2364790 RepID=UPI0019131CB5|nr:sigma-70 family RNA polymerase sigma factor [Dysgonomonas sp. Marseille-P4677]MBK5719363.1 sigma-70 family RNA polymerase sigma factor [Dysgonomonas sp. Marseille-P4677]
MKVKVDLEKAFVDMIRSNERIIYKVCSFYVSDELLMSDLYQEVVCNLWSAYPRFRNESSVSTWIYRISLNTCISGLRKDMLRPKGISVSLLQNSLAESENTNERIKEMYRLIHQLKSIERAIILLWLEEKSYQEIADITGLSVSNVATKLKRSKEKLKQMSNL